VRPLQQAGLKRMLERRWPRFVRRGAGDTGVLKRRHQRQLSMLTKRVEYIFEVSKVVDGRLCEIAGRR